ncbi:prepilin peptidase [Deferribacter autotrophicus]|uniref:Prepilin leader peptidase/N-methyltransferase n=1 Tax=Deferribacter autotrophicus TaxID=500465 RepID=A0A5A8F2M0_9BACT|nr:A24 family peptidase [Deferribacter autotrophicus]KAA0257739.1 prepilin peptidase [Deferribacter autotrophicus]
MGTFIIFIIGTIFGSFYNVIICRLPYGESIVTPSSKCPQCNTKIKWYDNIPIISYLILKGKCRNCNASISVQYPLIELTTGLFTFFLYKMYGFDINFFKYFVLLSILLCAGVIDFKTALDDNFETGIIPNELSLGGFLPGFIFALIEKRIIVSLVGAAVGFLLLFLPGFIYKLLTGKEGMGGGDIKLFAMIGSFLGFKPLFFILFASSLLGAVVGVIFIAISKNKDYPIPFGPFIGLATFIYIFFGNTLINAYLKILTA